MRFYTLRVRNGKKNELAYVSATNKGFIEECCGHMVSLRKSTNYWNTERCIEEAKKYQFRTEWQKQDPLSYRAAHRNNIIDICCSHMEYAQKPNGYWSLDRCKEEALKYSSRIAWEKGSISYVVAQKAGWLKECSSHMKYLTGHSLAELEILAYIQQYYPDASHKRFTHPITKKIKELDVYIKELNKGIEYNGTYWHGKHFTNKGIDPITYHNDKRQFFADLNIPYLEIEEQDWNDDKQSCLDRISIYLGIK